MTTDERLDHIYDAINALMHLEAWHTIDSLMASDFIKTDDDMLAVLTATLPAKSHLNVRPLLFSAAKAAISEAGEDWETILKGLE